MRTREAKKVIRKIAKREGISEYEVRREMEKAIRIGFMNGGAGHRWNSMFEEGSLPSPEEFIMKVSRFAAK